MDEFERRIRDARPLSGHRHLPLTGRAKQELADLVLSSPNVPPASRRLGPSPGHPRRFSRRLMLIASSLAAFAIAGGVTLNILPDTPASAATPPLLVTDHIDASAEEILDESAKLMLQRDPPPNRIRMETWVLNTEIDANGTIISSSVEPRHEEITFVGDGNVHVVVTVAPPFPGQKTEHLATPGTVLSDETFAPGEFDTPYPEAVPTEPTEIADYLATVAGSEQPLGAGETIQEVSSILSSNVLSRDQESALLSYVSGLPDLEVAGRVTDRLGRDGIAIRATDRDPGHVEDLLIISPRAGSITAAETIYIGNDRTDIASPSVIHYVAWDR